MRERVATKTFGALFMPPRTGSPVRYLGEQLGAMIGGTPHLGCVHFTSETLQGNLIIVLVGVVLCGKERTSVVNGIQQELLPLHLLLSIPLFAQSLNELRDEWLPCAPSVHVDLTHQRKRHDVVYLG